MVGASGVHEWEGGSGASPRHRFSTPSSSGRGPADTFGRFPGRVHRSSRPLVIAHRGASGYRPEHTLEAYRLAARQGADYIEPDLVSTKDGVLVARHENELSATTDVADHRDLADRFAVKVVDGRRLSGWFAEDLTLEELQGLRARSRWPLARPVSATYDDRFRVPTLSEILDLADEEGRRRGRVVGVYPEIKHPSYFAGLGLGLEQPLVRTLTEHGVAHSRAPVHVQSFEPGSLYDLDALLDVPLAQLVDVQGAAFHLLSGRGGCEDIATYANVLAVAKQLVLPGGPTGDPSDLVSRAHAAGLEVHVWGDVAADLAALFDAGVDGVFTDHPDTAVLARDTWVSRPAAARDPKTAALG